MSRALAVVYEAPADFRTATELADRVLMDAFEWLEPELIDHHRTWLAEIAGFPLTWKRIKGVARENGIFVYGHFNGQPGEPDAKAAQRAIRLVRYLHPEFNGVMLIRDQDDQIERRDGLEQARKREEGAFPVVIGLAIVERESWVISGFDPEDDPETKRLAEERQALGFDPRHRSHELTACKNDQAKRSSKRVLEALTNGDKNREQRCWSQTELEVLKDRGSENGLAIFLEEVRKRFAPLIGHVAGT